MPSLKEILENKNVVIPENFEVFKDIFRHFRGKQVQEIRGDDRRTRILGICLGAQMIAQVMGAQVQKNLEPEVGWFPVQWEESVKSIPFLSHVPANFIPFHWHFDTYALPSGAVSVARSKACRNQAFIVKDRIVGFQFHPEMTEESIKGMLANCSGDLSGDLIDRPYIQNAVEMLGQPERVLATKNFLFHFLNAFCPG